MKFVDIPKLPGIRFRRDLWMPNGYKGHCWIQREEPTVNGITYWKRCEDHDEWSGHTSAFDKKDVDIEGDDWEYFPGPKDGLYATDVETAFNSAIRVAVKLASNHKSNPRFLEKEINGPFKRVIQVSTGYEIWVRLSDLTSHGIEVAFYEGFKNGYRP